VTPQLTWYSHWSSDRTQAIQATHLGSCFKVAKGRPSCIKAKPKFLT